MDVFVLVKKHINIATFSELLTSTTGWTSCTLAIPIEFYDGLIQVAVKFSPAFLMASASSFWHQTVSTISLSALANFLSLVTIHLEQQQIDIILILETFLTTNKDFKVYCMTIVVEHMMAQLFW